MQDPQPDYSMSKLEYVLIILISGCSMLYLWAGSVVLDVLMFAALAVAAMAVLGVLFCLPGIIVAGLIALTAPRRRK